MRPRLRPLIARFAALLLLGASAGAQSKEYEGWVYNGLSGWGSGSVAGLDDSSFSSNPNFGYRWGNFGVEAGYAWFGDFNDVLENGTHRIETKADLKGWNAGVNFNRPLGGRWTAHARAGLFDWHVDGSVDDNLLTAVRFDDHGTDWYAGVSATWQSSKRSSVGLGYTHFAAGDAHADLWGLATEFRF